MSEDTPPDQTPEEPMTARQAYNLVTDTVTGPNVRLKDNLFQAAAIFNCALLGAGIGFLAVRERVAGVIIGGLIGLVVGLLGSGIFLMIYRATRHIHGKHD